jgi:hypothetical protein
MSDPQDQAEQYDTDKLGGEYPPDEPLGADEGRTDEVTESFAERDARHEPEAVPAPAAAVEGEALVEASEVSPQDEVAEVPQAAEEAAMQVRSSPDDAPL